jgi:hypothetical protein
MKMDKIEVFLFSFSPFPSFDFCAEWDEVEVEKKAKLIYVARLRYAIEVHKTELIYARITRHYDPSPEATRHASKLIYARVTRLN